MRQALFLLMILGTLWFAGKLFLTPNPNALKQANQMSEPGILSSPEFHPDIAPIIYESCSPCHRPGQAAPFSLLTYEDVRKRGTQIRDVVESGFMPPWLPDVHSLEFENSRRMNGKDKQSLIAWMDAGMPVGQETMKVHPPEFPPDWKLGPPDMVLTFPRPYTLQAEGKDVYRNFTVPSTNQDPVWIRTVEFKPNNPSVIHHAVVFLDRTRSSMKLDQATEEPGFGGDMSTGQARIPDGHFIGWTPGKFPNPGRDDMAWLLTPGASLVIQLHMRPGGKPEVVQPSIGLYFNPEPPTKRPYALVLRNKSIDIPAGTKDYRVTEDYTLPVTVQLWSLYPHAHYLGRDLKATAVLPNGESQLLIHIPAWDFNWQDEYRLKNQLTLPKGTRIIMDYLYDNTADNIFNPSNPVQRVRYGQNSDDEMGELMLQVVPEDTESWQTLARDVVRRELRKDLEMRLETLQSRPDDPDNLEVIAKRYLELDQLEKAEFYFKDIIPIAIGQQDSLRHCNALLGLADCAERVGNVIEAVKLRVQATQIQPENAQARHLLGESLARLGYFDEALEEMMHSMKLDPELVNNLNSLARVLVLHPIAEKRDPDKALTFVQRALTLTPEPDPALFDTLGLVLAAQGQFEPSMAAFQKALLLAKNQGDLESVSVIRAHIQAISEKKQN